MLKKYQQDQRCVEIADNIINSNILYNLVIKSFKDKATETIFSRQRSRKIPNDIQQITYRKLRMLNNAKTLIDLKIPPANRLEKLKGDRLGQYSIRINEQWRLCFEWYDGDAYQVELVDYH